MGVDAQIDEIGPWSEIKLEIISKYARAYSSILDKQGYFQHVYIDAFAGLGYHKSRETQEIVEGSPRLALEIEPPFKKYFFIDINGLRVRSLQEIAKSNVEAVTVYEGDCNSILVDEILPTIRYEDYVRGLCLLDPYGLHLDWKVIELAGSLKTTEVFLNFPIMDMNMNVLKHDLDRVDETQAARMSRFWGDDSWREIAYSKNLNLFGWEEKESNDRVVEEFCLRLRNIAGFNHVSRPLPMKNSRNSTVYYLIFASPKPVALDIVDDIYKQYE